jgi:hypothetical protein
MRDFNIGIPEGRARCRVPNFWERMFLQSLMTRVAALFAARPKMQKQEPRRENSGAQVENTRVIPNDVRVLYRARWSQPLGN